MASRCQALGVIIRQFGAPCTIIPGAIKMVQQAGERLLGRAVEWLHVLHFVLGCVSWRSLYAQCNEHLYSDDFPSSVIEEKLFIVVFPGRDEVQGSL